MKIFEINVLKSSDCPFILTALKRRCINGNDVQRMFKSLMDLPNFFNDSLPIINYDYAELNEVVETGQTDEGLRSKINEIYKKRIGRSKREKPLAHDACVSVEHNLLGRAKNAGL